jgi:predicted nucleic acid-binding Zn ribbon protein
MPKTPSFTSASQVLKSLIAQYGLEGPLAEHRLREHWSEVVGNQIAGHAQPDKIRFRKLYLSVDSPAWMQELAFLRPTLLEKVNAALRRFQAGVHIQEVILQLGPSISTAPSAIPPGKFGKQ